MANGFNTVTITPNGVISGAGVFPLVGLPVAVVYGETGIAVDVATVIPLQPVPAQIINVTLNNQSVTLSIYTKTMYVPAEQEIPTEPPALQQITVIFMDVYVNDALIIGGVLCLNEDLIVRNTYLGFVGDLAFVDTQGLGADPEYTGLGSRWQLCYYPDLQ